MSQADAKQSENGNNAIDSDKHQEEIAQSGCYIVSLVIREMFSSTIEHCEQPYHQACPKKENQESKDHEE